MAVPTDKFTNQAYLSVTESAANTLTFKKLETGVSIYQKVGWLVSRLIYSTTILGSVFTGEGQRVTFGLSVQSGLAQVGMDKEAIVDFNELGRVDLGTAASGYMQLKPMIRDFSSLPGGGLLIPPNPIYLYAQGTSLAAARSVACRMFYTVIQLKNEDFWELVEMRRMISTS